MIRNSKTPEPQQKKWTRTGGRLQSPDPEKTHANSSAPPLATPRPPTSSHDEDEWFDFSSSEEAQVIYRSFRDKPRTVRVRTPYGPTTVSQGRGGSEDRPQSKATSRNHDFPNSQGADWMTYNSLIQNLRPSAKDNSHDAELAQELLTSINPLKSLTTPPLIQSVNQMRAAALLLTIGFICESHRKKAASPLFMIYLNNVANRTYTFDDINDAFQFSVTAAWGREQVENEMRERFSKEEEEEEEEKEAKKENHTDALGFQGTPKKSIKDSLPPAWVTTIKKRKPSDGMEAEEEEEKENDTANLSEELTFSPPPSKRKPNRADENRYNEASSRPNTQKSPFKTSQMLFASTGSKQKQPILSDSTPNTTPLKTSPNRKIP